MQHDVITAIRPAVSVSCLATRVVEHVTMSGERVDAPQEAEAHGVVVRDATREDLPAIHQMIQKLAAYEDMADGPQLTVDDLAADGFEGSSPWFFELVAEREGAVVGHAMCNRAYSSWTGRALYVEDLFVAEGARGAGVGRALFRELCARARRWGVSRVDWHVLARNRPARRFYARLGAHDLCAEEGRAALRLYADRIAAVADGHLLSADHIPADFQ